MTQAKAVDSSTRERARLNIEYSNVLLLSENAHGLELLTQMLGGFGIRDVHKACTIAEAQAATQTTNVDLFLIDPDAENVDVYEFIHWLRRSKLNPQRHAPVIVTTGLAAPSSINRARDVGANIVILKPLKTNTLLERIRWVARERRTFIECDAYVGPDRRFQNMGPPPGSEGRRKGDQVGKIGDPAEPNMSQSQIDLLLKPQKAKIDGV